MKNIIFCFLLVSVGQKIPAQQLIGRWYSSDSSRIYDVKASGTNQWKAVIYSSTRKDDKIGYEIIPTLVYNKNRKRFEGYIYSEKTDLPAFAKITFSKSDGSEIKLKLGRLFIFDAILKWSRVNDKPIAFAD